MKLIYGEKYLYYLILEKITILQNAQLNIGHIVISA